MNGDTLPAISHAPPGAIQLRDIKAETAIAIRSSGRDYMVSARDLVEWVAPQAPIGEAKKFLLICQTAGLNPLLGDIDLLPFSGKWQAVVRKNGYLKCARRDPDYDGHESGITVQAYQTTPKGQKVKTGPLIDVAGTLMPDGHLLVGGWCKLYKRGISRPFYKRVSFAEYGKSTVPGPWQSIPCTMIEKVAIAHVCRESIDLLAATYDDSEFPLPPPVDTTATARVSVSAPPMPIVNRSDLIPAIQQQAAVEVAVHTLGGPAPKATAEQVAEINALVAKVGMSPAGFATSLDSRGVRKLEDLDVFQASDMISKLTFKASRAEWDPFATPAPAAPESAPAPAAPEVIDVELSADETPTAIAEKS